MTMSSTYHADHNKSTNFYMKICTTLDGMARVNARTMSKSSSATNADDRRACCPPLLGPLLDDGADEDLAGTLKALSDPIRLKLINMIAASGEACACDLPDLLDRSQPTVSHHLSILVKAGLLEREQRGKWAWFRLNQERLNQVRSALG